MQTSSSLNEVHGVQEMCQELLYQQTQVVWRNIPTFPVLSPVKATKSTRKRGRKNLKKKLGIFSNINKKQHLVLKAYKKYSNDSKLRPKLTTSSNWLTDQSFQMFPGEWFIGQKILDRSMMPYVLAKRGGLFWLEPEVTWIHLQTALKMITKVIQADKKILFVNPDPTFHSLVKLAALQSGQGCVVDRWVGGLLSNAEEVLRSSISQKQRKTEKASYSKRNFQGPFRGFFWRYGKPGLIFFVSPAQTPYAVQEAAKMGLPTMGILDSETKADSITFKIPGNPESAWFIYMILDLVVSTIYKAQSSRC
jgi:small subunit ribosomal protein S2